MDFGLDGKIALVSGGSKGMGRAVAESLAAEGVKVVVAARGQDAIDATLETIKAQGGQASGISLDLYAPQGAAEAVAHCARTFGEPPDIAVANVYGADRATFDEADEDLFREGYEKIVVSSVRLARAVLPHMKERRWGRYVTIGSFCAKQPHSSIPLILDNVSRAGAVALSKSLSNEFGPYGVTINTVAPGFIDTDMARAWMAQLAIEKGCDPKAEADALNAKIPVRRLGTPEEFAGACIFLCSQQASYITGQTLLVDGGLVPSIY